MDSYKRYKYASNGISLRSVPGSGNYFLANSDEHDEFGYSTEEIEERNKMMKKRMQKLITCADLDMPKPTVFGSEKADITIVSWGSNKGSILEAIRSFSNVNFVHLTWMSPFPSEELKKILSGSSHIVDIESNYSGQLANLIREKTGIEIKDRFLKCDGRVIYPEEIVEKLSLIKGVKRV